MESTPAPSPASHTYNPASSPASNTPRKPSIHDFSATSDEDETHVIVDPHLKSETRDTFQYDVPVQNFFESFLLPSNLHRHAALQRRIDAFLAAITSSTLLSRAGESWVGCTNYGEAVFLSAFCHLWQSLIKQSLILPASVDGVLPLPARNYRENRTHFLAGTDARQKLDFYVCSRGGQLQCPRGGQLQ